MQKGKDRGKDTGRDMMDRVRRKLEAVKSNKIFKFEEQNKNLAINVYIHIYIHCRNSLVFVN